MVPLIAAKGHIEKTKGSTCASTLMFATLRTLLALQGRFARLGDFSTTRLDAPIAKGNKSKQRDVYIDRLRNNVYYNIYYGDPTKETRVVGTAKST